MSPTGESPDRASGFTLIELMVTLALAGLLLALVPPLLSRGGDRGRLDHDRRALVSELRLARSEAIMSGRTVNMRFDLPNRRYGTAELTHVIDDGVTLSLETPLADRSEIRFFPDGSASGALLSLSNRGGQATVQVDWLTGKVRSEP
jgi:general secretion pathway protein H